MGIFSRRAAEKRAEYGMVGFEDPLLQALLGGGTVTKKMALQVPSVSGGIDLIANVVAGTPIKLYRDEGGKAMEVRDDYRIRLLNDETGDALNANEFWKAIVRDYYVGKGGYAYIHREKGTIQSLHYVDEEQISIRKNTDPIFKEFDILVQGAAYRPYDFLKILRNTKDGASGTPITEESSKLIEVAYQTLLFELYLVKKGGNKKGFLKAKKKIDEASMTALREAYSRLYSNTSDNVVVLNDGIEFQESSNTSTEMQMNENKASNALEFAKLFHISTDVMEGKGGEADTAALAKLAAIPLMVTIQCALNRDFLLEKEKGEYYWAFDSKELLRGSIRERFDAYKTALDANFMQIDEVRYAEDLDPLGLSWIKLGLNDVLYDPKTKQVYTPNTNRTARMGEERIAEDEKEPETELPIDNEDDMIETRSNPYHDPSNGRFTSGPGGERKASRKKGGKAKYKYSPSFRRNQGGIDVGAKKYAQLCGTLGTRYPGLKEGEERTIWDAEYQYHIIADGYGGMIIISRSALGEGGEK